MPTWEEDQADIFGAAAQEELNNRMRANAGLATLQPGGAQHAGQRPNPRPPSVPRSIAPMYDNDHGDSMALGAYNLANNVHTMQGNYLQGMANQVTDAIGNELQSRVAQAREWRRMQHEKEMKKMELDALIARLNMAR